MADQQQKLTFQSDKGASRSLWIAGFLVVVLVGWMGSGFIIPSEDPTPVVTHEEPKPVAVAVTSSLAEPVTQFYQAEGQALPDRDTMLRAETTGEVAEVFVRKGQDVGAGAAIARLDPTRSNAEIARAQEELARTQRDYNNAQQLLERGVATATRVSDTQAVFVAAQAQLTQAEEAAKALIITAPFAGPIGRAARTNIRRSGANLQLRNIRTIRAHRDHPSH